MDDIKFTPGTWAVQNDLLDFPECVTAPSDPRFDCEQVICSISQASDYDELSSDEFDTIENRRKANAYLIAAAPELYEALNNILKRGLTIDLIDPASAALAKARGETP